MGLLDKNFCNKGQEIDHNFRGNQSCKVVDKCNVDCYNNYTFYAPNPVYKKTAKCVKGKTLAKEKLYKRCPRCNEKTYINKKVCDNCNLVFSRLEFASNKKAKEEIRKGNAKTNVIMTKTFPRDVNRWVLFIICAFGGALGIHNIYIGRYIKGFFSLFMTLLTAVLISVLDGASLANLFSNYLFIPAGIVFIFWFYDLLLIGINQYKVPIAIDMPQTESEK